MSQKNCFLFVSIGYWFVSIGYVVLVVISIWAPNKPFWYSKFLCQRHFLVVSHVCTLRSVFSPMSHKEGCFLFVSNRCTMYIWVYHFHGCLLLYPNKREREREKYQQPREDIRTTLLIFQVATVNFQTCSYMFLTLTLVMFKMTQVRHLIFRWALTQTQKLGHLEWYGRDN